MGKNLGGGGENKDSVTYHGRWCRKKETRKRRVNMGGAFGKGSRSRGMNQRMQYIVTEGATRKGSGLGLCWVA